MWFVLWNTQTFFSLLFNFRFRLLYVPDSLCIIIFLVITFSFLLTLSISRLFLFAGSDHSWNLMGTNSPKSSCSSWHLRKSCLVFASKTFLFARVNKVMIMRCKTPSPPTPNVCCRIKMKRTVKLNICFACEWLFCCQTWRISHVRRF